MEQPKSKKSIKIIFNIIKIIFLIFLILSMVIAVTIIYKAKKYPEEVPDIFGIKPFIVLSSSMETEIYSGDLVFTKIIDANELKEGDIIAFRNEEDTVTTHRIIEIQKENEEIYFKTQGDNNNSVDKELVSANDLEGIYIGRIPKIGSFLLFLQEPIGLLVSILILTIIFMIWFYFANKRENEKYKKEIEELKEEKRKDKSKIERG